jgi:DNA-binding XRE family transcriptional regulator
MVDDPNTDDSDYSANLLQGQRLSDLRSELDIPPVQLAKSVGITTQELLAIEAGLMRLSATLALRLAREMGVRYSEFWIDDK